MCYWLWSSTEVPTTILEIEKEIEVGTVNDFKINRDFGLGVDNFRDSHR